MRSGVADAAGGLENARGSVRIITATVHGTCGWVYPTSRATARVAASNPIQTAVFRPSFKQTGTVDDGSFTRRK